MGLYVKMIEKLAAKERLYYSDLDPEEKKKSNIGAGLTLGGVAGTVGLTSRALNDYLGYEAGQSKTLPKSIGKIVKKYPVVTAASLGSAAAGTYLYKKQYASAKKRYDSKGREWYPSF